MRRMMVGCAPRTARKGAEYPGTQGWGHACSVCLIMLASASQGLLCCVLSCAVVDRRARPRVRLNKVQAAALNTWISATAGGKCRPASRQADSTADVCLAGTAAAAKKR